jgi:ABC-type proline/glycine betaine transport system ATPase subunit
LASPADAFVAELLGHDRLLKLLRTTPVAKIMSSGGGGSAGARIAEQSSLEEALLAMLAVGQPDAAVLGSDGRMMGSVTASDIVRSAARRA